MWKYQESAKQEFYEQGTYQDSRSWTIERTLNISIWVVQVPFNLSFWNFKNGLWEIQEALFTHLQYEVEIQGHTSFDFKTCWRRKSYVRKYAEIYSQNRNHTLANTRQHRPPDT